VPARVYTQKEVREKQEKLLELYQQAKHIALQVAEAAFEETGAKETLLRQYDDLQLEIEFTGGDQIGWMVCTGSGHNIIFTKLFPFEYYFSEKREGRPHIFVRWSGEGFMVVVNDCPAVHVDYGVDIRYGEYTIRIFRNTEEIDEWSKAKQAQHIARTRVE